MASARAESTGRGLRGQQVIFASRLSTTQLPDVPAGQRSSRLSIPVYRGVRMGSLTDTSYRRLRPWACHRTMYALILRA